MAEIFKITQHVPGPKNSSDSYEKEQKYSPFIIKKVYDANGKEKKFTPLEIMEDDELRNELKAFFSRIKSEIENIDSKPDKEEWIRKIRSWNLKNEERTKSILESLLNGINEYGKEVENEKKEKNNSKKVDFFTIIAKGKSKVTTINNKAGILKEMFLKGSDINRNKDEIEKFLTDKGVIQIVEEYEQKKTASGRG